NSTDWKKISQDFNNKWQFPNCLGAVDGKQVRIIPTARSGSMYFNYKKYHSVVLMAVADADYRFIISLWDPGYKSEDQYGLDRE
uniref:DDE Tnp4 domain-containing protein n=1 Tax=Anopheles dirus TaxID=7168 RepID=A0A182NDH7_9DIPT